MAYGTRRRLRVHRPEWESLLLENLFIKRHKPRYNTRLKGDKTYPYIKIYLMEDVPQIYITRRAKHDDTRYFGPFVSAGSVRKTLDLPDHSQRMLNALPKMVYSCRVATLRVPSGAIQNAQEDDVEHSHS